MLTDFKKELAGHLCQLTGRDVEFILNLLESPKEISHGHLAFPVFFMARQRRKSPLLLAQELAEQIQNLSLSPIREVCPVGGYVNIHMEDSWLQDSLWQSIEGQGVNFGHNQLGQGQCVVIDFASPNVAKPMSVGHLRATVIGQALYNLAKSQGYKVIALNHLGDWGVQFGKLAWAYQEWGHEYNFKDEPFETLFSLYVRFHEQAEKDKHLNEKGAMEFKKLESGDKEVTRIWKQIVHMSLVEYQKVWDLLGVKFDLIRGESFYNDRLKSIEKRLEKKGLLEESEGAQVVRLDEEDMPPCLIRKSDGASLYATRDIASAIYRMEELGAHTNIYVVGVDQTLHFKQIFSVMEKMGCPWVHHCHHISFGMYRFKDKKMSTRQGNVIFMRDIVYRAIEIVKEILEKNKPNRLEKEKIARQVGVGAIIFNDLCNDRVKDIDFNWDQALDFEGNSGPYVQYCQVRCQSLMRKYAKKPPEVWPLALESDEERVLVRLLHTYEETLRSSFKHFKPHFLATYLVDVCRAFGHFYSKHRIIGEPSEVEDSRMGLVFATQRVLENGLNLLNIESPEEM